MTRAEKDGFVKDAASVSKNAKILRSNHGLSRKYRQVPNRAEYKAAAWERNHAGIDQWKAEDGRGQCHGMNV